MGQQLHPLPQPPPPRASKRKRNVAAWVLVPLLVLAATGGAGGLWWYHHKQQAAAREQSVQPAPVTPCPDKVISHLPAGEREGAVLLHHYLTQLHDITLCTTGNGAIYYHGEMRDKPSLGSITLPAERTATGYVARNKGYTYTIDGSQVTVRVPGGKSSSYTFVPAG
jgi:hypothetical protein